MTSLVRHVRRMDAVCVGPDPDRITDRAIDDGWHVVAAVREAGTHGRLLTAMAGGTCSAIIAGAPMMAVCIRVEDMDAEATPATTTVPRRTRTDLLADLRRRTARALEQRDS